MALKAKWKRPYRKGVGAVIFNCDGLVLAAERLGEPGAWQFPQGGLSKGEKPRQAVIREVIEEIGTDRVEILAKSHDWLSYDLPGKMADKVWKGRYRGQIQRWFALRFTGDDSDIDLTSSSHPEFSAWKWLDLDVIPSLAISFKRPVYETLVREFKGFAGAGKL